MYRIGTLCLLLSCAVASAESPEEPWSPPPSERAPAQAPAPSSTEVKTDDCLARCEAFLHANPRVAWEASPTACQDRCGSGSSSRPWPSAHPRAADEDGPAVSVEREPPAHEETWSDGARFFGGARLGVGIPPGGSGLAPEFGAELGVSAKRGLGFGLHIIGMMNPPSVPALNIPKTDWGIGALADLRLYFQTVEPLTLYGTLSAGFLAGPGNGVSGNVVLPLLNPGFGARVKFSDTSYVAFEFGLASFFIPFLTLSFGWEPVRKKPAPA